MQDTHTLPCKCFQDLLVLVGDLLEAEGMPVLEHKYRQTNRKGYSLENASLFLKLLIQYYAFNLIANNCLFNPSTIFQCIALQWKFQMTFNYNTSISYSFQQSCQWTYAINNGTWNSRDYCMPPRKSSPTE
jgi:hypothetical protein